VTVQLREVFEMAGLQSQSGRRVQSPVAVEKLTRQNMAENTLRSEALQTTFSVFLDIFYPSNLAVWDEKGVFQQPRLISTVMNARTENGHYG